MGPRPASSVYPPVLESIPMPNHENFRPTVTSDPASPNSYIYNDQDSAQDSFEQNDLYDSPDGNQEERYGAYENGNEADDEKYESGDNNTICPSPQTQSTMFAASSKAFPVDSMHTVSLDRFPSKKKERRKNKGWIIGGAVLAILVLTALILSALALNKNSTAQNPVTTSFLTPTADSSSGITHSSDASTMTESTDRSVTAASSSDATMSSESLTQSSESILEPTSTDNSVSSTPTSNPNSESDSDPLFTTTTIQATVTKTSDKQRRTLHITMASRSALGLGNPGKYSSDLDDQRTWTEGSAQPSIKTSGSVSERQGLRRFPHGLWRAMKAVFASPRKCMDYYIMLWTVIGSVLLITLIVILAILWKKVSHYLAFLKDPTAQIKEKLQDLLKQGGELFGKLSDNITKDVEGVVDDFKKQVTQMKDEVSDQVEKVKNKAGDVIDDGKDKAKGVKSAAGHLIGHNRRTQLTSSSVFVESVDMMTSSLSSAAAVTSMLSTIASTPTPTSMMTIANDKGKDPLHLTPLGSTSSTHARPHAPVIFFPILWLCIIALASVFVSAAASGTETRTAKAVDSHIAEGNEINPIGTTALAGEESESAVPCSTTTTTSVGTVQVALRGIGGILKGAEKIVPVLHGSSQETKAPESSRAEKVESSTRVETTETSTTSSTSSPSKSEPSATLSQNAAPRGLGIPLVFNILARSSGVHAKHLEKQREQKNNLLLERRRGGRGGKGASSKNKADGADCTASEASILLGSSFGAVPLLLATLMALGGAFIWWA
ncbi:unnamed protein product [Periconia digitata]|uniref:Uncharacterized protein n=1 Tax=Periconia digitata TaxID=1303443 RepID=A0A9W4UIV4_9PLEO|nr:unnamed protein product [Periconia digitata]